MIRSLVKSFEALNQDKRGQVGGINALIGVGFSIFLVVILFNALGLNTGLYATLINTLLPLLPFGVVAAILIALFR